MTGLPETIKTHVSVVLPNVYRVWSSHYMCARDNSMVRVFVLAPVTAKTYYLTCVLEPPNPLLRTCTVRQTARPEKTSLTHHQQC